MKWSVPGTVKQDIVMLSGAGGERSEAPAESKHPYPFLDSRDGNEPYGL